MTMKVDAVEQVSERVKDMLRDVELEVLTEGLTLSQLIREGSQVSDQSVGWTDDDGNVCALSAAEAALRARM